MSQIQIVEKTLDKEEARKAIVREIDILYQNYKLPSWNISEEDMDFIFETINRFLKRKGIEEKIYTKMLSVFRLLLAEALVNKRNINISSFVDCLDYLIADDIVFNDILEKDIENLKKEFNGIIQSKKIIIIPGLATPDGSIKK